jgi:hypothetical protein
MKKLVLVSYGFKTGAHKYDDYVQAIVETEHDSDPEQDRKKAEVLITKWFNGQFKESELLYVVGKFTVSEPIQQGQIHHAGAGRDVPVGWFTNDSRPWKDHDGQGEEPDISDLVLIDVDGNRETFVTGKWHFPFKKHNGWWQTDADFESSIDPDNMRWSYLPLAKYEK